MMLAAGDQGRLRLALTITRSGLGLVWLLEGLLPKLLAPSVEGLEVMMRGLPPALPAGPLLTALGVAQCLFGLWLLSGYRQRLAAGLSTAGVVAATAAITAIAPEAWVHFYGGAIKNLVFIAAGASLWLLAPLLRPQAPGRL